MSGPVIRPMRECSSSFLCLCKQAVPPRCATQRVSAHDYSASIEHEIRQATHPQQKAVDTEDCSV